MSNKIFIQKFLILTSDKKIVSISDDNIKYLPELSEDNFNKYGMNKSAEIILSKIISKKDVINEQDESNIEDITPTTLDKLLGNSINIVEYTTLLTKDSSNITLETEPFSVYDYIGDTPQVLVYNELDNDIIVSTSTEPFTLYDEFSDEIEVLCYTGDSNKTNMDLLIDANYSPIDDLNGDLEIVTWTDGEDDIKLNISAVPTPKFIYSNKLTNVSKATIKSIISEDLSDIKLGTSKVRYLLSNNNTDWYTWNNSEFIKVGLNNEDILNKGLTAVNLSKLDNKVFNSWKFDNINVGVYLEDDLYGNIKSKTETVNMEVFSPVDTPSLSGLDFYILNTTATIDLDFSGLTLTGSLSDADMSKVQYRVLLNNTPYYPTNGDFTELSESPENIYITLNSEDVKIDDWNKLVVEFQDSFGTTDSWEIDFVGKYAGLIFSDENNNIYSTDVGKVIKYLDFGEVLTGQSTAVHEVKLKNQFGFDVTEVNLAASKSKFNEGLEVQFSKTKDPFDSLSRLYYDRLDNEEEASFFIRMTSGIDTVPSGENEFDIFVTAKRVPLVRKN